METTIFECFSCETKRRAEDLARCAECKGQSSDGEFVYFCVKHCSEPSHKAEDCNVSGHATCFDTHFSSPAPRLQKLHRRALDAAKDWCIHQIVYASKDYTEQQKLHERDQRAEWFRVEPRGMTPHGRTPLLQISQRFEDLWRSAYPIGEAQYPSFVTFLGHTGHGKSSLVRAMMIMGVLDEMKYLADKNGSPNKWLNGKTVLECRARGPVTRSRLAKLSMTSTSVGVHLYHDSTIARVENDRPSPESEKVSILFADCEGFRGSTSRPTATTACISTSDATLEVPDVSGSSRSRSGSVTSASSLLNPESVSKEELDSRSRYTEIKIRANGLRERGPESSELFYARYLYAFSDVVVFVTSELQSLGNELRDFLTWISKAEKHSIPPRTPRTLVIVVNNTEDHYDDYYDEEFLKTHMFNTLGEKRIWEHSDDLYELKNSYDQKFINKADRITNNDKFFKLFFQHLRFCYIPRQGNDVAEKQYDQYRRLRNMIVQGATLAQKDRSERMSRYDVPMIANLMDKAFYHFANEDTAFDFHVASGKDNPTPMSLAAHIASMLRHTGTQVTQLQRFVDVLSICLIVSEYRSSEGARQPDVEFDTNLHAQCLKGIQLFQDHFQPCSFRWEDNTLCTAKGLDHESDLHERNDGKGHRHSRGTLIKSPMNYASFEILPAQLIDMVRRQFVAMYEELHSNAQKPTFGVLQALRRAVLGHERSTQSAPFPNLPTFTVPSSYFLDAKSNKTCFCCLQSAPDHFLSCGHGYCADCVKDFGEVSTSARYTYRITTCVLCGPYTKIQSPNNMIRLDPRAAGVRILTLDGGGIRGIIELAIIHKIEQRVNLGLSVRELFDLMVGTSTGGIIALGLGTGCKEGLSTPAIWAEFMRLAQNIFEKDRIWLLSNQLERVQMKQIATKIGLGLLFLHFMSSRYSSRPRRDALKGFFTETQTLFGPSKSVVSLQRSSRVAVTASSSGELCTFANYSRGVTTSDQVVDREHLGADRDFIREEYPQREAKTWEAAMATSAAPTYFTPWRIDNPEIPLPARRQFTDGAVQANMPLEHALHEKEMIWPAESGPKLLDISVSIGTGYAESFSVIPSWLNFGNLQEVAKAYYDNTISSEKVWEKHRSNKGTHRYQPGVDYRLNVDLEKKCDLDDWAKMSDLLAVVEAAYTNDKPWAKEKVGLSSEIDTISFQLVASLLFFEPEKVFPAISSNTEYIHGYIWTRLDASRQNLATRSLLSRIKDFYHLEGSEGGTLTPISFRIPGIAQRQPWWKVKDRMISQASEPLHLPVNFERTADLSVQQSIYVELLDPYGGNRPSRKVRISGFPTTYGELLGVTTKKRGQQSYYGQN